MIGYLCHEYGSDPYTRFTKSSCSPAVLPNLHDIPAEQADIEASENCRGNADGGFLEQRKKEKSSRCVVDIPECFVPATCPMWVFLSRKYIPANDKMPGVHTG